MVMDREKLLQQCSNYFKNNGGYNRVLKKIRDKYKSLGKIGGTIKLENLTQNEKDALTGFLGKNFYKNSITIKLERFQNALKDTPYRELSLIEVLNEYFGEEILTKKIEIGIYERDRKNFFNEIIKMFIDTIAYEWLEYTMNSKQNAYRILTQRYDSNKEKLKKDLIIVCKGLNNLPCFEKRNERLALFASKINKDPHTFDERMECGKLLLSGIVYILNEKYPKNAENNAEILYRVGLIKDEMSNFTMFSGLLAYKENEIHKGWEGFYNLYEPMQVSLLNLSSIEKVKSPKGKVFVFENPTVFSEVLHRTIDKQPALMCTYGQVKLASLILLDMLTENGTQIYSILST